MVSRPTLTAVSASISTPVRPTVSAVTVQRMACAASSSSNSTATRVSGMGWQSGISSLVRLEAWIAAMRAMPSTSPFFALPDFTMSKVAGSMWMRPVAMATRRVSALAPTSTMWAWPSASKWVSGLDSGVLMVGQRRRCGEAAAEIATRREAPLHVDTSAGERARIGGYHSTR